VPAPLVPSSYAPNGEWYVVLDVRKWGRRCGASVGDTWCLDPPTTVAATNKAAQASEASARINMNIMSRQTLVGPC